MIVGLRRQGRCVDLLNSYFGSNLFRGKRGQRTLSCFVFFFLVLPRPQVVKNCIYQKENTHKKSCINNVDIYVRKMGRQQNQKMREIRVWFCSFCSRKLCISREAICIKYHIQPYTTGHLLLTSSSLLLNLTLHFSIAFVTTRCINLIHSPSIRI